MPVNRGIGGGVKAPAPKKVKLVFPKKAKSYTSLVKDAPKSRFPKATVKATPKPVVKVKTLSPAAPGPAKRTGPKRTVAPNAKTTKAQPAKKVVTDTVQAIQSRPDKVDAKDHSKTITHIIGADGREKPQEKRGSLLGNLARNARDVVESAPTVVASTGKMALHGLGKTGEDVINLGPGTRSKKYTRAVAKDAEAIRKGVADTNPVYHLAEAGVAKVRGNTKLAKAKLHQAGEEAHKRPLDAALTVLPAAKALDAGAAVATTAAKAARVAEVKHARGLKAKTKALVKEGKGRHHLAQARPDKVVRASPRKGTVNQLHRDRTKARVKVADRQAGHTPAPAERVLASKPQHYSKGLITRAVQRGRENVKAAKGVDPTEVRGKRRVARAVRKDATVGKRNVQAANVHREVVEHGTQHAEHKLLGRKHRDLKRELVDLIAQRAVHHGREAEDLHHLAVAARKRGSALDDRNARVYDDIASKLTPEDHAVAHQVAEARVTRDRALEDRQHADGYFDGTDPAFVRGVQSKILKGEIHKQKARKPKKGEPAPDGGATPPVAATGSPGAAGPRPKGGGFQGRPKQGAPDGSQVSGETQHVPGDQADAAALSLKRDQARANAAVRVGKHRATIQRLEAADKVNAKAITDLLKSHGRDVKTATGGVRRSVEHHPPSQEKMSALRRTEHQLGKQLEVARGYRDAAHADMGVGPDEPRPTGLSGGSGNRRSDAAHRETPGMVNVTGQDHLKKNASREELQSRRAHLDSQHRQATDRLARVDAKIAKVQQIQRDRAGAGDDAGATRAHDALKELRVEQAEHHAAQTLAHDQLRATERRLAASDELHARDDRGAATSPDPGGSTFAEQPPKPTVGESTPTPTPETAKSVKTDPGQPGGYVWTKGPRKGQAVKQSELDDTGMFIRGVKPGKDGIPPTGPNVRAARSGYSDTDTLLKEAGTGRGGESMLERHRIEGQREMAKMFQQRYAARGTKGDHVLSADEATKVARVRNGKGQLEWEPVRLSKNEFVVLPKVVNKMWQDAQKPLSGLEHAGHILTRQFVRTILPFSVSWHAGNVVDLTARLALSGGIGVDLIGKGASRRQVTLALEDAMKNLDPHLRDLAMSSIQGHLGSQHGGLRSPRWSDMSEPGKKSIGNALSAWRKAPGASTAAHGYDMAVNKAFAASSKLEGRLTQSAAGLAAVKYAKDLGIQTADHITMAEQLAGEFKNDPRMMEEFQRRTLQITGDYVTKTAAERRMANTIAPFYTWLRAANTFVFRTLPKNHPYKTAFMLQAAALTEPERRKLGLSYYLSAAETKRLGLPQQKRDYFTGAIPLKDHKLLPTSPFTSFGEAGKLLDLVTGEGDGGENTGLGVAGSLGGPGFGGVLKAGLKAHQGGPMTQGQVALSRAIEAYFPGARQARKIQENGGASHSSSTFWHGVSNKSSAPFDPFGTAAKTLSAPVPGRPFGESKKDAAQRAANARGDTPPGGIMHLMLPNGQLLDIKKGATGLPTPVAVPGEKLPGAPPVPSKPGSFKERLAALGKMPAGAARDKTAVQLQNDIARHLGYLKEKGHPTPALIEHKAFALNPGGNIVSVPGAPGEEAAKSIVPDIEQTIREFDVLLTDAYDRDHSAGHKSPGHNVTGTAADFAGTDAEMGKAAHYWASKGYIVGYDGTGGTQDWPGHGPSTKVGANAHLHVEFGSPASAGTNGAAGTGTAPAPDPSTFAGPKKATATVTKGANMAWRVRARKEAIKNGLDPDVYERQIQQESGFTNPGDNSSGAAGVAQFIRGTAAANGLRDRNDVGASLAAGARLMGKLVKQYGSYARALSAYNSGRPDAYQDPGFAKGQTYNYVKIILGQTSPDASTASPMTSSPVSSSGGGSAPTPKVYPKVTAAEHQAHLAAAKKAKVQEVLARRRGATTNTDGTVAPVTAPDQSKQLSILLHALQDGKLTIGDVLDLNAAR